MGAVTDPVRKGNDTTSSDVLEIVGQAGMGTPHRRLGSYKVLDYRGVSATARYQRIWSRENLGSVAEMTGSPGPSKEGDLVIRCIRVCSSRSVVA
jgi:hypothetical protein